MSEAFVVDSSVSLAWVLGNQASDYTHNLLTRQKRGATIVVTALWYYEIANGLMVALRRKLIAPEDYSAGRAFFRALRVTRDDEGIDQALLETSALSQRFNLTVYDGSYLELAVRKCLPLATRDAALKAAAKKCGVEML